MVRLALLDDIKVSSKSELTAANVNCRAYHATFEPVGGSYMRPVVVLVMSSSEASQLSRTIEELGYSVRLATGIDETAELLDDPEPIAILSELALPDGNWRDLVARVRSQKPSVPVVLCSRSGTAELWWDALENGVSEILVLPVQTSDLKRVISDLKPVLAFESSAIK